VAIYLTKVYYVYKPFIFNTKNAKSAVQLAENAVGALATALPSSLASQRANGQPQPTAGPS